MIAIGNERKYLKLPFTYTLRIATVTITQIKQSIYDMLSKIILITNQTDANYFLNSDDEKRCKSFGNEGAIHANVARVYNLYNASHINVV